MTSNALFDTDENKALIAICTRKLISNIGIGGIIWGIINLAIGIVAIQVNPLNVGLLILGAAMLGTGIQAIKKPSLGVLLTETIVTVMLFFWNVGIAILNYLSGEAFDPRGIVFPLVIAIVFANYYRKLGHLREHIASVEPEKIKTTKLMCKTLLKKKLKTEPLVVQSSDRKCRAQLLEGKAFFIQRDMMKAFVASKDNILEAIAKPEAKKLKMTFEHPVGKLSYYFDKKNSEKLSTWLAADSEPVSEPISA